MNPLALFLFSLAVGIIILSFVAARRQRARSPSQRQGPPLRLPPLVRHEDPQQQMHHLCDSAAKVLGAHVAVFLAGDTKRKVIASAPGKPHFELFETIAADWAMERCIPTGRGTGVMAHSDWQFQPVLHHGGLYGLIAVAGRRGREPILPDQVWALEDLLRYAGEVLVRLGAPCADGANSGLAVPADGNSPQA